MTYATPAAFRMALEARLNQRSTSTGVDLQRLRRRILFQRILARLESAEPGRWVLKGGMALEVRMQDDARLTKDLDLGLRDPVGRADDLHERLVDALSVELDSDGFVLTPSIPDRLADDSHGQPTWRTRVDASLAGRPFGAIRLDVSPRDHELDATDRVALPNLLDFAGVPTTVVEIVDVHRHAAEKFHAMLRQFPDRDNSRVRDLVDVVLLIEHEMISPLLVADAARRVWDERDASSPPLTLASFPRTWPARFVSLVGELDVTANTFESATEIVGQFWAAMFPDEETHPDATRS